MSDRPDLARLATDALAREDREENRDHARSVTTAKARDEAIAAIARAMQQQARTQRMRRVGFAAALLVAAGALVGLLALRLRTPTQASVAPVPPTPNAQTQVTAIDSRGEVSVVRAGQTMATSGGARAGDRITTGTEGSAIVTLSTGTKINVGAGVGLDLALLGRQQVFGLASGTATFAVAKLSSDERFLVRTVDAELEVRGTVFEVSLAQPGTSCAVSTKTRLVVKEGLVVVHHQGLATSVAAGDMWPAGCASKSVVTNAPVVAPSIAPSVAPSSDLAQQNDAYAKAVAAKKSGNLGQALAGFDGYLTRWPHGPLAESAMVERMRLLTGPQRVAAAKAYLARYPKGFAATEARALVEPPSP